MRILCAALLLLALPVCARAQNDLTGPDRFPQFRGLSGLAGGGFGVDPDGRASLTGATAFSTPIAHVLGHSQWRLGYSLISRNEEFTLDFGGGNGTGVIMYGHSFPGWNVAISDMFLSNIGDQAFNLQAQWVPQEASRVQFSIGVQDISGDGGSAGTGIPGDNQESRSFFGVATFKATEGERPLWISGGIGSRRFKNGFVNASLSVADPVRIWGEFDGFDPSFGVLLSARSGSGERPVEFNVLIGIVKKYPTIALGVGF